MTMDPVNCDKDSWRDQCNEITGEISAMRPVHEINAQNADQCNEMTGDANQVQEESREVFCIGTLYGIPDRHKIVKACGRRSRTH